MASTDSGTAPGTVPSARFAMAKNPSAVSLPTLILRRATSRSWSGVCSGSLPTDLCLFLSITTSADPIGQFQTFPGRTNPTADWMPSGKRCVQVHVLAVRGWEGPGKSLWDQVNHRKRDEREREKEVMKMTEERERRKGGRCRKRERRKGGR